MEQSPSSEHDSCSVGQENPYLHEPECSFLCSQETAVGPCATPVESSANLKNKISFSIILELTPGHPNSLVPSGCPTEILYVFLISPCVLHVPPISTSLKIRTQDTHWKVCLFARRDLERNGSYLKNQFDPVIKKGYWHSNGRRKKPLQLAVQRNSTVTREVRNWKNPVRHFGRGCCFVFGVCKLWFSTRRLTL
jgi:hypothetical protein